jgi:hypothetical protein
LFHLLYIFFQKIFNISANNNNNSKIMIIFITSAVAQKVESEARVSAGGNGEELRA